MTLFGYSNRFVHLHFAELNGDELIEILHRRCLLPRQYAGKMLSTMAQLHGVRSAANVFAGRRESYMTLRDLFRWAARYTRASSTDAYTDWEQFIVDHGQRVLCHVYHICVQVTCYSPAGADVVKMKLSWPMHWQRTFAHGPLPTQYSV
jgi:hypothetical protein